MRSGSTGIPAASPLRHAESEARQAGFTLVEALVALSLLLAFAAALGPLMFHGRQILLQGDGQIRANLVLRSLIAEPFDRVSPPQEGVREGEAGDLRWRLDVEPVDSVAASEVPVDPSRKEQKIKWSLFRVTARIFWGAGRSAAAETVRLGRVE
jgi:prepilin-type N-terminal cleavage/methylation domain-containing protein